MTNAQKARLFGVIALFSSGVGLACALKTLNPFVIVPCFMLTALTLMLVHVSWKITRGR